MATPVDFPKYLQFLVESYQEKQHLYTLTDLQVEVRVEISPQEKSPFPPENKPETKIDRLQVLTGLRKYVQQGNVLLVGKPGSGKSTVLQRFRWELALEALKDGDQKIPVLVELRHDWSILEAICAEFENAQLYVSPEEVNDLRVRGKLLLLLDGVNEMPSQKRRQELQRFHDKNSHTRMIFTTRDLALGGSLGIEKQLEMCALTQSQMREFVRKYLPQHGDSLLRQLRDRLREIAETPLLLKMMCEVFASTGEIPQSKGELFQKFDRRYDEIKGITPVSDDFRRFKSDLLQQLAFVMLQGDSPQSTDGLVAISRDRAERILECWLRDRGVLDAPTKAKEWLEDLLEHHLLQVAAKPEEIEFHHQLFQEYYAGRALLKLLVEKHDDAIDDKRLQHFYLNYFKWTEPLAFMLSLLADENRAVRVVRLALDVDLMLGARLAGEVQRVFQQRAVGLVDGLDVPGWLKVGLLGEVRSDEAIPGLLEFVEDSDWKVRSSAVNALGKMGSEAAIPGLLKLVEDSDDDVRSSVAYALGDIGSEAAIPGLLKLVEDSYSEVRWNVANALGNIGSDLEIYGLTQLVKDSDCDVRLTAAEALEKIDVEAAIPGLIEQVKFSDFDVPKTATDALEKNMDNDTSWVEFLEDMNKIAKDTLGKIDYESALIASCELIQRADYHVHSCAETALEIISYEAVILGLIKLVENSESDVRSNAANMLVAIAQQQAERFVLHLPHLLTLIPSKSGEQVHRLILAIQAACKYYNYPIHQLSLTPAIGRHSANASASIYIQSVEQFMSNQPPIFNQQNATLGVNYAAENSNPKIIQKIEAAQQSSPEAALNAVVQIIQALEKKYTYVQDEQQALNIIDAEFKEIKEQKGIEWQNLISLKRLYNGGKKAAVKVGEHFAESNPWGKGLVAFIEGVSEDVN